MTSPASTAAVEDAVLVSARAGVTTVTSAVSVSSSFAETVGTELGLGEVVTYQLEVFLPEVLSNDVTLVDAMPPGLTPLAARVTRVGAQLSADAGSTVANLMMPAVTIAGQTLTIGFDDVLNTADGMIDTGDRIVIEVDAVLDADAVENLDGETVTNTVDLTLTAGGTPLADDDTADVTVVTPDLSLTKTAASTAAVDAGDVITYTLSVPNTGTGPAYDLAIEDLMADAGLSLISGTVMSSDGSVATEVANPDGTLGFTIDVPVVDAGQTLTITYLARVTDAALFDASVDNTARVVSFDTNPGEPGDAGFQGEVTTTSNPANPIDPLIDDASVPTVTVALAEATSVGATDQAETGSGQLDPAIVDLSVGEEVVYTLTLSIPEGTGDVLLTDALPAGMLAQSAEVLSFAAGITSANLAAGDTDASASITISAAGDQVQFDFGTVVSQGFAAGLDDPAGAGDLRTVTVQAVSYTHLTLPTIFRV